MAITRSPEARNLLKRSSSILPICDYPIAALFAKHNDQLGRRRLRRTEGRRRRTVRAARGSLRKRRAKRARHRRNENTCFKWSECVRMQYRRLVGVGSRSQNYVSDMTFGHEAN